MSTTYSTPTFVNNVPANTGHGLASGSFHLHAISGPISTWAAGDVINVGYLPRGAVVIGATLKAASQLDSNGSPTLTLSLGIPGTAGLFKSAITTVGRASGASADQTIAAAGVLYKGSTTARTQVIVTVGTAAATAVSGTLEVDVEFYVEDAAGSNP